MATRAVGTPSQRRACDAGDGRAAGPRAAHRSVCGSATLLVVRRCATAPRQRDAAMGAAGRRCRDKLLSYFPFGGARFHSAYVATQ